MAKLKLVKPITDITAHREALADTVIGAFAKLAEHRDDMMQLWREFASLQPGETIKGCGTKTEFCAVHLGRSMRAVQYMLAGGNPSNRREIISLPAPAEAAVLDYEHMSRRELKKED